MLLLHHLKSTGIEPSQDFGTGQHPVVSPGEKEIDTPGGVKLGKDSFDNIVEGIDHPVEHGRILSQDALPAHIGGFSTADKDALVGQLVVNRLKKAVDIPEIVDPPDVHNGIEVFVGLTKDVEAGYGGGDQGARIGQVHMTVNEMLPPSLHIPQ